MKNIPYWLSLVMAWTRRPPITAEEATKTSRKSDPVYENPPAADFAVPLDMQALIARCEALGRDTARKTRALKMDPAVLKALEETVTGWARSLTPPRFDPGGNAVDKRTDAYLTWLDQRLSEQRDALDVAAAELRKREEQLATLGPLKPFPNVQALLKVAANAGITFSLAPAIHDFLPGLQPLVRWAAAVAFGQAFAYFITSSALPVVRPDDAHVEAGRGEWSGHGVFAAGLITSIAFFGARMSLARTYRDFLVAFSAALMEIGILVCVERKGGKLRGLRSDWSRDRDECKRIAGLRDVALAERDARIEAIRETERSRTVEDKRLKGRVFGTDVDAHIATATAAVRAAYLAQVAENKILGIVPEE